MALLEALLREDEDGNKVLCSPRIGIFRAAPGVRDSQVAAGDPIGSLEFLGRRYCIAAPAGAEGTLRGRPERHGLALGYGDLIFRLDDSAKKTNSSAIPDNGTSGEDLEKGAWTVTAPIDGIFYRRPSPEAAPYVDQGDEVVAGQVLGLIEVMKTFNPVRLPAAESRRARVKRIDAPDQGEVQAGALLFVLEPASGPDPS